MKSHRQDLFSAKCFTQLYSRYLSIRDDIFSVLYWQLKLSENRVYALITQEWQEIEHLPSNTRNNQSGE